MDVSFTVAPSLTAFSLRAAFLLQIKTIFLYFKELDTVQRQFQIPPWHQKDLCQQTLFQNTDFDIAEFQGTESNYSEGNKRLFNSEHKMLKVEKIYVTKRQKVMKQSRKAQQFCDLFLLPRILSYT